MAAKPTSRIVRTPKGAAVPSGSDPSLNTRKPSPLAWVPALLPGLAPRPRRDASTPLTLGRMGSLEVRLAAGPSDIARAQALRYRVFYQEMAAIPSPALALLRRDADIYDPFCDHVIVVDHATAVSRPFRGPMPEVVATYRLLRQDVARRAGGFYSEGEFELRPLIDRHPDLRLLELGRSCVLKPYRNKRTVELLWHGVWTYIRHHRMDAMFGCGSLEGVDAASLATPLAFLKRNCLAPEAWRVQALPSRRVEMDQDTAQAIDPRSALHALPPLIKGYLRLGAWVGDGAVVDRQFGTTDVFLVLPSERISSRYIEYFGVDATRHAA